MAYKNVDTMKFNPGMKLAITADYRRLVSTCPPIGTICSVTDVDGDTVYFESDTGNFTGYTNRYIAAKMHFYSKTVKNDNKQAEREIRRQQRNKFIDWLMDNTEGYNG